jgi:hypothetical protein
VPQVDGVRCLCVLPTDLQPDPVAAVPAVRASALRR